MATQPAIPPGDTRPTPPADLLDEFALPGFHADPALWSWARAAFVDEDASLLNEDHRHLRFAKVGFLWTNVGNTRHLNRIVGQAETGTPRAMGKWAKARVEQQITGWFGDIPDFIITLDGHYASQCGDAEFCSLVEHELYHCGQERDEFGQPKFTKDGRPVFAMRGHDVEEFVGIVRRYGVGAAAGQTLALVEAAQRGPEVAASAISQVCGTCQPRGRS